MAGWAGLCGWWDLKGVCWVTVSFSGLRSAGALGRGGLWGAEGPQRHPGLAFGPEKQGWRMLGEGWGAASSFHTLLLSAISM